MARFAGLLVLLALFSVEASTGPSQNPVEGVIKLITRLEAKIQEEGKTEAAAYDKFACFCKEQADEKLFSITKKSRLIAELGASIKKLTAGIETFGQTMADAKARKKTLEGESEQATSDRADEHADFNDSKDDRVTAINEILTAIDEVKASAENQ